MDHNSNVRPAAAAAAFIGIFFFGVAFLVLGAILPSLTSVLNLSDAEASTLTSTLPLGTLLGSLIFGPVIDRYGYKLLLSIATILGIIGMVAMAYTSTFTMAVASVFIIGLCGGMLNGSTNALISDASNDKNRTSNIFILGLVYCLGAYAIAAVINATSKYLTYQPILLWTSAIMFASLIYYLIIKFPEAKCKQGIPVRDMVEMLAEPTLLLFAFTLFFQSALEGIANNWTSQYLCVKAFTVEDAGRVLTFIPIGLAISRALLSVVSRFASNKTIVLASMVLAVAGTLCLRFAESKGMAIAGALIVGMGLAATFPVCFSILGQKYKQMSGTAFSVALVIALIGNFILNKLVGLLGAGWLPAVMTGAIALLVVLFICGCSSVGKENK